jgi:predicted N-acetyltransferase YhbS
MAGFETREQDVGARTQRRPGPGAAHEAVSIRPARTSELGQVARLFASALRPYRGSGSDWVLDAYLAELVDVRPRFDEAEVLVAERDGRIVGTVAFYADVRLEGWSNLPAGWAGFRALAVHPRMRGAGIGEALVHRCVERTRDVGAETLGIHTIAVLTDAVRLYGRVGFVRCPEFDLRAADIFPSENADEMVGLAFRLDVERAPARAR